MSSFKDIYKISLMAVRTRTMKMVRESERCYNSLQNKDSDYARVVKALGDLHKQAADIYKNAPDEIESGES